MATYVFGDLHGCYDEFSLMLDKIKFKPGVDELIITGDLIGRGPKPLETLNTLIKLKKTYPNLVHCVLGNHDLHFLSVQAGLRKAKKRDLTDEVLNAPNINEILNFYFNNELVYVNDDKHFAVVHAGIYPKWSIDDAVHHSKVITDILKDPQKRELLLANMYADHPTSYYEGLEDHSLNYWRFIISSLTRMRLCSKDLELDYGHSNVSVEEAASDKIYPWFNFTKPYTRNGKNYELFFGHWAALRAKCDVKYIHALDTGCVWGGELTCYCVDTKKTYKIESNFHSPLHLSK